MVLMVCVCVCVCFYQLIVVQPYSIRTFLIPSSFMHLIFTPTFLLLSSFFPFLHRSSKLRTVPPSYARANLSPSHPRNRATALAYDQRAYNLHSNSKGLGTPCDASTKICCDGAAYASVSLSAMHPARCAEFALCLEVFDPVHCTYP